MIIRIFVAGFLNYLWNDIVTHIPWHGFRKSFLRLINRKISYSSVILLHVRILHFWRVEIGDRSVINQHVLIDCRRYPVRISHDVDIGPYTKIWTLGHDPHSPTHEVKGGDVLIQDHVWIASGVTVLPAVVLGRGCVVASTATVTKNIPSLEIWAGNPASKISERKNALAYHLNYNPFFE